MWLTVLLRFQKGRLLPLLLIIATLFSSTTSDCSRSADDSVESGDFESNSVFRNRRSDDNCPDEERVFIMVKPDGLHRALLGDILSRFEKKGFQLMAIKMMMADRDLLENHYAEHKDRQFFSGLINFMSSGPVVPMVWQGKDIIQISRKMLGATSPVDSLPGTIRGDFGASKEKNLCHVSDSVPAAEREIELWFHSSELVNWNPSAKKWVF